MSYLFERKNIGRWPDASSLFCMRIVNNTLFIFSKECSLSFLIDTKKHSAPKNNNEQIIL
jgi:hypothetical protein